jgi:hypothetical protein
MYFDMKETVFYASASGYDQQTPKGKQILGALFFLYSFETIWGSHISAEGGSSGK